MRTTINIISGIVLATYGLVSCSSQNREGHDAIVTEWVGKEIILPEGYDATDDLFNLHDWCWR